MWSDRGGEYRNRGYFVVEKRADFWELFGEGDRGVDRREAGGE